jgi:hypothetical protein
MLGGVLYNKQINKESVSGSQNDHQLKSALLNAPNETVCFQRVRVVPSRIEPTFAII